MNLNRLTGDIGVKRLTLGDLTNGGESLAAGDA